MTAIENPSPALADLYAELERIADNTRTFGRLLSTDAKIAQTDRYLACALDGIAMNKGASALREAHHFADRLQHTRLVVG